MEPENDWRCCFKNDLKDYLVIKIAVPLIDLSNNGFSPKSESL